MLVVKPVNTYMIKEITWQEIEPIWRKKLWPKRVTAIEPISAMCFTGGHDMNNMLVRPHFLGFFVDGKLVGVNSGHSCPASNSYRSRGLWVEKKYRGRGFGQQLLMATIEQGFKENREMVWSYPRFTSWVTYQAAGFQLYGDWHESETSALLGAKLAGLPDKTLNAYCFLNRK